MVSNREMKVLSPQFNFNVKIVPLSKPSLTCLCHISFPLYYKFTSQEKNKRINVSRKSKDNSLNLYSFNWISTLWKGLFQSHGWRKYGRKTGKLLQVHFYFGTRNPSKPLVTEGRSHALKARAPQSTGERPLCIDWPRPPASFCFLAPCLIHSKSISEA